MQLGSSGAGFSLRVLVWEKSTPQAEARATKTFIEIS